MREILIRFLIGGLLVSFFSLLGDVFKPKSFAGLFGAAPSVALATLALTVVGEGVHNAAVQAVSMMAGAVALFFYSSSVSCIMIHRSHKALTVTIWLLPIWAAIAFGLWYVLLR